MARAFSLCRMRPSDCSKCIAVMEFGSPVSVDLYFASSLHTEWAAGPHPPPSASHMRGMNWIPSSLHIDSVSRYILFLFSYIVTAIDPFSAERSIMSLLKPLVTARSRAAGVPRRHLGRYTSAGLRFEFESLSAPFSCAEPSRGLACKRPGRSSSGLRPALWQKWNTSLRIGCDVWYNHRHRSR